MVSHTLRQDSGWSDITLTRGQAKKEPNENFGARKCYLGLNFGHVAPKGPTWQPCNQGESSCNFPSQ